MLCDKSEDEMKWNDVKTNCFPSGRRRHNLSPTLPSPPLPSLHLVLPSSVVDLVITVQFRSVRGADVREMTESSVWPDVGGGGGTKVICLSVLLGLTALTNLTAAPVILFRRTRWDSGPKLAIRERKKDFFCSGLATVSSPACCCVSPSLTSPAPASACWAASSWSWGTWPGPAPVRAVLLTTSPPVGSWWDIYIKIYSTFSTC